MISVILLVAGLGIVVASGVGMAVMDDPMDRLHLVTPAAMLGAVGVCASVVVRTGLSGSGLAAIVVVAIAIGTSPFTSHAMARSILVRRRAGAVDGEAADNTGKEREADGL